MSRLSKEWKSGEKPCYFRLLMKRHCVIEKGRVILSLNLVKPKCLSLNNQWLQSVILFPLNIQMMWAAVSQTSPSAWNWPPSQRFHQLLLHSQGCCLENVQDEASLPWSSIWAFCKASTCCLCCQWPLWGWCTKMFSPSLWPGIGGRGSSLYS